MSTWEDLCDLVNRYFPNDQCMKGKRSIASAKQTKGVARARCGIPDGMPRGSAVVALAESEVAPKGNVQNDLKRLRSFLLQLSVFRRLELPQTRRSSPHDVTARTDAKAL